MKKSKLKNMFQRRKNFETLKALKALHRDDVLNLIKTKNGYSIFGLFEVTEDGIIYDTISEKFINLQTLLKSKVCRFGVPKDSKWVLEQNELSTELYDVKFKLTEDFSVAEVPHEETVTFARFI